MLTSPQSDSAAAHDCAAIRAQVFAACDGELTSDAAQAIDAHLHGCNDCRQRFAADAVFHRAVRAAVSLDAAPASLHERVHHALQARATENAPA